MEQKGKLWKSFRHYKRAIDQYPSHIPYIQILKRENDLAYYYDKEYRKRFLFFSLKGNDKATQIYQHIADAGVDLQFTPQAMYRLAFLHQENHDSEAAMVQFRELISEYPDHSLSTDARIELGRILIDKVKFQIDRGITKEAYRFVSPVANQSPHHPRIEEAKELLESIRVIEAERLLYLAKFYQRKAHKRNEVSRRYLTNLLENYRQTSVTDKAEALLITIK